MTAPGALVRLPDAASLSWRRTMVRDIVLVLGFKVIALVLLWCLFFSASHRPRADTPEVGRFLGVGAAASPRGAASDSETLR